jgi:hypothetical protein
MTLHAKRLGTYLNDHLAAATGGVELVKRALGSNEGTPYGAFLTELKGDLEADKATLLEVMDRLDVDKNAIKESLGWAAEKLGRLKLNDQLTGYSPLSRVVEFEGLALILAGNRALWATIADVTDVDVAERVAAAERHAPRLEELRAQAVREALVDAAN